MSSQKGVEENANVEGGKNSLQVAESNQTGPNAKKEKYPYVVFLIIVNEFCERFSFYGMRTILFIYFTQFIRLDENTATAVYHAYSSLCYFTPILGAIIADGFIGLYSTIVSLSVVYLIGEIIVTLTSIAPLGAPNVYGPVIGLILIAFGTGGIKPCVSAFGGNQFKPSQTRYLENFFSVFYLSINVGSTLATILTPIFRSDVKCFGNDCYPLAFGVPALFMLVAIFLFLLGTPFYVRSKVQKGKNIILQTVQIIFCGIRNKIRMKKFIKKDHWLDYAEESNFSKQIISDVKAVVRVFVVFVPLPIFWTLYDQQGSRWTEQAQQLSGRIGRSFTIKPDQFQAINPILIVALVPIFDAFVYPFLAKFNLLKKQLQRILVGLLFASASFGVAAVLEKQMQSASSAANPMSQIRIINMASCDLELTYNSGEKLLEAAKVEYLKNQVYKLPDSFVDLVQESDQNVQFKCSGKNSGNLVMSKKNSKKVFIFYEDANGQVDSMEEFDFDFGKKIIGKSNIRFMTFNLDHTRYQAKLSGKNFTVNSYNKSTGYEEQSYANYLFEVTDKQNVQNSIKSDDFLLEICAKYTVFLFQNPITNKLDFVQMTDFYQNGVVIWWQLIQIFVMTVGEIMFSISGVSFAYSQAPASMKSVLQAIWFLTVAFGNLIVVIIAEARAIDDQVYEYVFFAGLMLLATIIFLALSYNYKYVEDQDKSDKKRKQNEVVPYEEDEKL
ncbi:solute carrier family 15 member 2-like [Brachionus plicatilis]|uniref:Solute carrier family 15 member 2-like n=1 Tax=Brachionus plicatilis TaxID=10195 RepID=A0A3M7S3Y4_BRAPC|nr:solute carrier family 15 member 2-like [Brachionus plicatilis]